MSVIHSSLKTLLALLLFTALIACQQQPEQQADQQAESSESTENYAEPETAEMSEPEAEAEPAEEGRGVTKLQVGDATISIDYGRPKLKGRDMLALATEGMVWRMGMNEATEIETNADLHFGDVVVPSGQYSLFMKKVKDNQWHLLFNEKTGIWGAPVPKEGFVATVPLQNSENTESIETFTIKLSESGEDAATFYAMWGKAILTADFVIGSDQME